MNTYIALFRGINVGGKNLLPMKNLIAILTTLGFEEIQTYIQSGNVVLSSKRKLSPQEATAMASAIEDQAGFRPKVMLLEATELQQAIASNPFDTTIGKAVHFFFLDTIPVEPDIAKLDSLKAPSEQFKLCGKVLFLFAPDGIGRSRLSAAVERCMGTTTTARNWNTVNKLKEMLDEAR